MINIVVYGCYLWILLKAYPNIIKSELLNDVKEIWGGNQIFIDTVLTSAEKTVQNMYKGVSSKDVQYMTSSIGHIQDLYGYEPLEKILVLACAMLACCQTMAGETDYMFIAINKAFNFLINVTS